MPVVRVERVARMGAGVGCGCGSSGPRKLGWRWRDDFCLVVRFLSPFSPFCSAELAATEVVLEAVLERVLGREGGERMGGDSGGGVGVGDVAFVRALFAYLWRNFSSSSEDVTSESRALKSILIALDSRLLRELSLYEGALFSPGKRVDPAKVSERLSLRTLAVTAGGAISDSVDIDDCDLLSMRDGLEAEISELSVVELGVEGFKETVEFRSYG